MNRQPSVYKEKLRKLKHYLLGSNGNQFITNKYPTVKLWYEVLVVANIL